MFRLCRPHLCLCTCRPRTGKACTKAGDGHTSLPKPVLSEGISPWESACCTYNLLPDCFHISSVLSLRKKPSQHQRIPRLRDTPEIIQPQAGQALSVILRVLLLKNRFEISWWRSPVRQSSPTPIALPVESFPNAYLHFYFFFFLCNWSPITFSCIRHEHGKHLLPSSLQQPFIFFWEMSSIMFSPLDYVIQIVLSSKLNKPLSHSKKSNKMFCF